MACSGLNISPSHIGIMRHGSGLRHSPSAEELYKPLTNISMMMIRRSCSENNLVSVSATTPTQVKPKADHSIGLFSFQLSSSLLPGPLRSLLSDPDPEVENFNGKVKQSNWVERLMELRRHWVNRQEKEIGNSYGEGEGTEDNVCEVEYDDEEDEGKESFEFDSESFSKLLSKVDWSDTKRFSQLAFLCNMAYAIPELKDSDLRRYNGLRFLTSSLKKKAEAISLKAALDSGSADDVKARDSTSRSTSKTLSRKQVYQIAASAASNCHYRAKGEITAEEDEPQDKEELLYRSRVCKSEMASIMAASTMTSMVAAKEKEKQQVAKELQSLHSSPCEWFICDDPGTRTRYFVIQGSDSLASWQANLLFEPTEFEGTEMVVHRGMYEAAKGIYEQFLPEIQQHLNAHGNDAKLQFTGHSLGGSLSLLIHLMLVARGMVKPSSLLPVTTFGSPFVFCGGKRVLSRLGVDESQVHCVIMHRDIVPRAFTCDYPNHVAQILKRLNGSFRFHTCLNKNKLLYSPLGQIFILQPEERSSPSHPLLPPGTALYALDKTRSKSAGRAFRAFLNNPHPLEILSDPVAYGSEGTIIRDHDSSNYLMAVNGVLKQRTKMVVRRVKREKHLLWPLLTSPSRQRWCLESSDVHTGQKEVLTRV
ncbi:hypothetical protein Dimus_025347 [Dionaea muscipula]